MGLRAFCDSSHWVDCFMGTPANALPKSWKGGIKGLISRYFINGKRISLDILSTWNELSSSQSVNLQLFKRAVGRHSCRRSSLLKELNIIILIFLIKREYLAAKQKLQSSGTTIPIIVAWACFANFTPQEGLEYYTMSFWKRCKHFNAC